VNSRRKKQPLTPIGSVIKNLLESLGLPEETSDRGRAMLAWEVIAGDAAQYSQASRFRDSVLVITVESPTWMQELTMMKSELLARLAREVGEGVVTDIRFEIDK